MIRALIFDFDGTIVESVDTKTQAFRTLFADSSQHLPRIVSLHLEHGGRSRFEKFAMIYRDILQRDPAEGEFDELGRRFEALVCDAVVACEFVPGAEAFLDEFCQLVPLIVISGTPHAELAHILERRGLASKFDEVHGSPPGKEDLVAQLLTRRCWAPTEVLFVGDAMSDWEAAHTAGVPFVGRIAGRDATVFPNGTVTVRDLCELSSLIRHQVTSPTNDRPVSSS